MSTKRFHSQGHAFTAAQITVAAMLAEVYRLRFARRVPETWCPIDIIDWAVQQKAVHPTHIAGVQRDGFAVWDDATGNDLCFYFPSKDLPWHKDVQSALEENAARMLSVAPHGALFGDIRTDFSDIEGWM